MSTRHFSDVFLNLTLIFLCFLCILVIYLLKNPKMSLLRKRQEGLFLASSPF